MYTRGGHNRAASSISGGWSVLPPLNIADTFVLHGRFLQQGLKDAMKIEAVIETLATNKIIAANTLQSSILQGVVLFSALVIQPLLGRILPADHSSSQSTGGVVYVLFHVFWLYPLAIASIVYSGLLRTPDLNKRTGGTGSRNDYRGVTIYVVGESYKALVLGNYLVVVFLLRWIPFIGGPLAFLYACVVDSYYCFEAQWLKSGWSLEERLKTLETRWSYFLGFGLPITMLSWWSSDAVVNLALFSFFFPFYRIMSSSSIPQPLDPNLPTSAMSISVLPQSQGSFSMAAAEGGEEARGRKGHPLVPVRIPVLFFADKIYAALVASFGGGGSAGARKKDAAGPSHYGHADAGGWRGDFGPSSGSNIGHAGQARAPPQQFQQQQYQQAGYSNGSAYSAYGEAPAGMGTAMGGVSSAGFVQSPPRRGHVQSESVAGVGMGGEFMDKNLDSLISQAGNRKKGD